MLVKTKPSKTMLNPKVLALFLSPQQNGVVERAFATIYNRSRAMFIAAGFSIQLRANLWTECVNTATSLDVITSKDGENTPFELFYGNKQQANYKKHLHPFGELAYIANRTSIQSKLSDRGTKVIFLGYAPDHADNVYRFYDPATRRLKLS